MKRILSVLLVLALMLGTAALAAEADAQESGWHNILLLGGDSRSTVGFDRTDSMIILSVNRDEGAMKLTSIMRDTWVKIPDVNFSQKINAANVYGGPELAVKTVNQYFGTDIEDYVLVNMTGLIKIIDLLGGVDVEVTESERKYTNSYAQSYLKQTGGYDGATSLNSTGLVHLNGLLAMSYARDRYTDSDYGRVMRQQKVLLALAEKAQDSDIDELLESVDEISENMQTNMTNEELKEVAMVCMTVDTEDVGQLRVPADGTFDSGTFDGIWMIRPNFEKNAQLLHEFIYGE